MRKIINNPLRNMEKARQSPRCTAKSKRSQKRCQGPAMRGWDVCRMHGAKGGAPEGAGNGNFRNGYSTKAAKREREEARQTMAKSRVLRLLAGTSS